MALVSLACALFSALGAGRVFASSFWLVRWIVCVLCDWSDWFLVLVLRHIFGNCRDCGRPWRPKLFDKVLRKPLKRCEDTKKNKKELSRIIRNLRTSRTELLLGPDLHFIFVWYFSGFDWDGCIFERGSRHIASFVRFDFKASRNYRVGMIEGRVTQAAVTVKQLPAVWHADEAEVLTLTPRLHGFVKNKT